MNNGMHYGLTVVTAPTVEPISLTEAKAHLRVDGTDDDTLISALITAARQYCEEYQGRVYITQTLELALDAFPRGYTFGDAIKLPRPPLQSVTSVTYYDTDGNATVWDSANYIVDTRSYVGRIVLAYGQVWPTTTLQPANGVVVRYVAGYGDAASDVPQRVRQAMLLLIGHWYENREAVTDAMARSQQLPIPFGVTSLLGLDRVFG